MMINDNREFEYEGRLVFNGLCRLHFNEIDLGKIDASSILPEYESGTPADPGKGFIQINLDEFEEYADLEPDLGYSAEDIIYLRYKKEEYQKQDLVNSEGETETVFARDVNTVDLLWIFPDYLLFRGPKGDVQEAQKVVSAALNDESKFERIEFHPDFLLWLLYIHTRHGEFSSNLRIDRLRDAKISGDPNVFGSTRRISGSTDILRSPPVITAILQNNTLETIGGYFVFKNSNVIAADISNSGRIHIKSRADIKQYGQLRRLILSSLFVNEILDTYYEWTQLEPSDKYPPVEFFEDLYERLQEEGVSLSVPLDEVIENYNKKRDGQ